MFEQRLGKGGSRGPGPVDFLKVTPGNGVLFNGCIMEKTIEGSKATPEFRAEQKIKACAKTRFTDMEILFFKPPVGQAVLLQKDVTAFGRGSGS